MSHREDIEHLMSSDGAKNILDRIAAHFYPGQQIQWNFQNNVSGPQARVIDPKLDLNEVCLQFPLQSLKQSQFPHFLGQGEQLVYIDLLQGTLFSQGIRRPLPQKFTKTTPLGKRLTKGLSNPMGVEIQPNVYQFVNQDGEQYIFDQKNEIVYWLVKVIGTNNKSPMLCMGPIPKYSH